MMCSVPSAEVLLLAAIDYLESQLMPTLTGYHRFQTRVTVNVLRTVERELRLAPSHTAAERERLAALLGHDGEVDELTLQLANAIRDGRISIDDPDLVEHLRRSLRDALAVNNPKWLAPPAGPELDR